MAEQKTTAKPKEGSPPGPQPGQDAPPGTPEHLGSDRPYEGAPYNEPQTKES